MTNLEIILAAALAVESAVLLWLGFEAAVNAKIRRILASADVEDEEVQPEPEEARVTHTIAMQGPAGHFGHELSAKGSEMLQHLLELRELRFQSEMESEIAKLEVDFEVPRERRWRG